MLQGQPRAEVGDKGGGFLLADGEVFFKYAPTDAGLNPVDRCDVTQALGGNIRTIPLIIVVQFAPVAHNGLRANHDRWNVPSSNPTSKVRPLRA